MTQIVMPPIIEESQLVFAEGEAKQILTFFFPTDSEQIEGAQLTRQTRCFAQSLLICAIDSSFAASSSDGLFRSVANAKGGIRALAKRLAANDLQHWWKHTATKDLEHAKVYENVRATIVRNFRPAMLRMVGDDASAIRFAPFPMVNAAPSLAWV